MQGFQIAGFVQILHKAANAALVAHTVLTVLAGGFVRGALIAQGDAHACIQKAFFPQALEQGIIIIFGGFAEHFGIRLKSNGGAVGGSSPDAAQLAVRLAAVEALFIFRTVAAHTHPQPLRAGVYHAGAHAVQTAGHLVAGIFAAKLAAGVQHGEHNGHRRQAGIGLHIHGNAAAVIHHFNDVVRLDGHLDMVTVASQRFVDGVIHDLVHQMVQAPRAGGTDVHTGALAHSLQALQNLNFAAGVLMVGSGAAVFQNFFCHFFLQCLLKQKSVSDQLIVWALPPSFGHWLPRRKGGGAAFIKAPAFWRGPPGRRC